MRAWGSVSMCNSRHHCCIVAITDLMTRTAVTALHLTIRCTRAARGVLGVIIVLRTFTILFGSFSGTMRLLFRECRGVLLRRQPLRVVILLRRVELLVLSTVSFMLVFFRLHSHEYRLRSLMLVCACWYGVAAVAHLARAAARRKRVGCVGRRVTRLSRARDRSTSRLHGHAAG
jgi:hypothetical protein